MKIDFPVSQLPSGGIIPPNNIKGYNRNTYTVELEGMTYKQILEYEDVKNAVSDNFLKRLGVCIDYLVPDKLKDYPLSDMYCIMSQVAILSAFDLITDAEEEGQVAPYFLTDVICPKCNKKHDRVGFSLSQINFLQYHNDILNSKAVWKSNIKFYDRDNRPVIYTFAMPTIREFRNAINYFFDLYESSYSNDKLELYIRLIALSLAVVKYEPNLDIESLTFEKKYTDLVELFENSTGGDAMKLERLYKDLLFPVILISDFCDCEEGVSELDVSHLITEVLRLLKINSRRINSQLYTFIEGVESESGELTFHYNPQNIFPTHKEAQRRIREEEVTDTRQTLYGDENFQ